MAKQSKVDINDLSSWPLVLTLIVGAVIIALFVLLLKSFLADDVTAEVDSVAGKITQQGNTYKKNVEIVAMLPHIRKEVVELKLIRDEAKKFLPTQVSMPSLIDSVYLAARNNGIVFDKFTPEGDIKREFYTIKPISLSAETGYVSMSAFVEEVTTLKRIMNVQSVDFKAASKNGEYEKNANAPLKMTAQLRTYIFNDDEEISSEKKGKK